MGAEPTTALAMAVVPFGTDAKMEETLFQMLAGASRVLAAADCALVGGHTCEGEEASLGDFHAIHSSKRLVHRHGDHASKLRFAQALL